MSATDPHDEPAADTTDAAPAVEKNDSIALLPALRNGAIICALSLVLLEGVLRFLGVANPVLYERNPDVGYRLKPDQQVSYLRNEIVINSFGVRDPRPLTARDPTKKRVLCLGDSVTWGGIYERQENLFTSVAERKLNDVEIINAGVNGYSTTQMARLGENYLTDLNPDLIVFCTLLRDFERPPVVQLKEGNVAFPLERPGLAIIEALKICQLSAYNRFRWQWLRPASATTNARSSRFNDDEGPTEQANIDAIANFVQKLNGRPRAIVVRLPVETIFSRSRLRRTYMESLERRGVKTFELSRETILDEYDFVDNVHLSTSGHFKVGGALAALLYDELSTESDAHANYN